MGDDLGYRNRKEGGEESKGGRNTHRIFIGEGDVRFWGNRNLNQARRHEGTDKQGQLIKYRHYSFGLLAGKRPITKCP